MLKLPEPFGGRPTGRLKGDGTLVSIRRNGGATVLATVMSGAGMVETDDSRIVAKAEIEPLNEQARAMLEVTVETEIREQVEIRATKDGERRTRK